MPRRNSIPVELLHACWDCFSPYIMHIFRAYFKFGCHTSCFSIAEVFILTIEDRDLTTTKGWRPIALLSYLGKSLEILIVKRMSHLAVTSDKVGHQQFGATPKHSVTDFVRCIVHNIEKARSQKWASTFVKVDIWGVFDAVLHN